MSVCVISSSTLLRTLYKNSCRPEHLKMSHPGRDIANFSADDRKRKNEEQQEESNKKLKKEQNWEMDFNDWSGHIESELKDEDVIRLENIQKKEVADYISKFGKNKINYYAQGQLFNYETFSYV